MEIAYTAHTDACTYLLDAEGICRSVLAASANGRGRPVRIPSSAERCIGAQYVAALDLREAGGLVATPKLGAQMLFARTEKNGRITLVRTGPLLRFEACAPPVAMESGVHARPAPESAVTIPRGQVPREDARPRAPSYGDDELTTPFSPPTIPFHRDMLPPIARSGPGVDRSALRAGSPSPPQGAPTVRSSSMPPPPQRNSGVVPAGYAARETIPPPPPTVRTPAPYAPPPSYPPPSGYAPPPAPRRPSLVRVSAPFWDAVTVPRRRAAR